MVNLAQQKLNIYLWNCILTGVQAFTNVRVKQNVTTPRRQLESKVSIFGCKKLTHKSALLLLHTIP
jgi:hypothetical protein